MSQIAQKVALTIHLETAASCIKQADFGAAKLALQNALQIANALNHPEIKKLVFRAMNHVRVAARRAA